jgi:predicted acylesterase/phospholipase RssA
MMSINRAPNEEPPLALIMKGGGIKGLAYVGAVKELSRKYSFTWFVGTSAGAITAVLLGAGYSADELESILKTKNFKDFFDASWWLKWWNIAVHHGFHRADAFTEWLDSLLAAKLNSQRRVRLSDLPFRVTVYASQRNKRALKFDPQENDADAAYAVRCSMSIPFVFVPQSDQGIRAYDGGLQHNYPVDELLHNHPGTAFVSLYLGPEVYEPVRQKGVIKDLLSIWTESTEQETLSKYPGQTVIIDPRPIGTLDFDLTETEKEYLVACGRAGALAHLDPKSEQFFSIKQRRDDLKASVEAARCIRFRNRKTLYRVVVAATAALIGCILWVGWLKPADLSRRRLMFSSRLNVAKSEKAAFDPSMPGITVHFRDVEIDLSNEVPVPAEERDTKKTSPSVHTYRIRAERVTDEVKYVVYEFASQRQHLDIHCFSPHPHAVWFRQDKLPLGKSFNNVWTLIIDVTRHAREIPFTIEFRVTRYNAYQAENKNFVGHLVKGDEKEIRSKVYLPRAYVLASTPRLMEKPQGIPSAKWQSFNGDAAITNSTDRRSFSWVLRNPKPGFAYGAEINWTERENEN